MDVNIHKIIDECLKEDNLEQTQLEKFYELLYIIFQYKRCMKKTEDLFRTFPGYYFRMVLIRRTFESLEQPLLSFKEMIASNVVRESNLERLPFAEYRVFQESPLKKTYPANLSRHAKRITPQRANRLTNKRKIPIAQFRTVNTIATRNNLPNRTVNRHSTRLPNRTVNMNSTRLSNRTRINIL